MKTHKMISFKVLTNDLEFLDIGKDSQIDISERGDVGYFNVKRTYRKKNHPVFQLDVARIGKILINASKQHPEWISPFELSKQDILDRIKCGYGNTIS